MSIVKIAVIGGSGFAQGFGESVWNTVGTRYGDAVYSLQKLEDEAELIFLPRHGPSHGVPPHKINHRANIQALKDLDVAAVIATSAVGSLRVDYAPGDFVVLDDFIDGTKGEVPTFFGEIGQVRHTDFSEPFAQDLRIALISAADATNIKAHPSGTYMCLSGPRYETPAEVRLYASWGAHVVGMTVAPEAILAREAGLSYAAISVVTNYGCGLIKTLPLSHTEVEAAMAAARESMLTWLKSAITAISEGSFSVPGNL